nr:putative sulfate exporter family transporter [uncultured Dethiosulfovibrio sp.]
MERIIRNPISWLVVAFVLSALTSSPATGLCTGALLGLTVGNPARSSTSKAGKYLLQGSVVLLGFGLQIGVVLKVGSESLGITAISIGLTLGIGWLLGRALKVDRELSTLLSGGTAICGGSAIAAIAPAIGASGANTAVAMAVVFLLNGVALVIFPPIGHAFGLTQDQFGLWAALAIHDTSSVVGAGAAYGTVALALATTVKLTRALWIVPVSFVAARLHKKDSSAKIQWFLVGFMAAALIRSLIPQADPAWTGLASLGKRLMTATLFLVGAGLTMEDLRKAGGRPLLCAILLWITVTTLSLILIKGNFISLTV